MDGLTLTILSFIVLIVEFWLGKTEYVKAGSLIELVLNILKFVLKFIIR